MNAYLQHVHPGIAQLRPYQPGKPIEELEREYGLSNIIKLASNENPLGPSPRALTAMQRALSEVWLYPDGNGFDLKSALAQRHGVTTQQLTLGNGSSEPLEFVVRALVQPGDEVLFSEHSFAIYPLVTQAVGGVGVAAPAKAWGYDLAALKAHITARTRVIFIANPNNPTGTWLDSVELEAFIATVPKDVVVVVDEAYIEYAQALVGDRYPDTIAWLQRYPNLMITRTFSKAYGLAGLRMGYAISHPDLADLMNRIRPPFNTSNVAQAAALAALQDSAHLQRGIENNSAGLQQLIAGFEQLGLSYIPTIANFISVDLGMPAAPIYDGLLRHGVITRPVANYGMPNHLRITIGLPAENQRFLDILGLLLPAAVGITSQSDHP